jgi:hypothetical protein
MPDEPELVITVKTEREPSIVAVAQFLGGVALMKEALFAGGPRSSAELETRLRGLTSPLCPLPLHVLESCGAAWAHFEDWPPMDALFRGGMTQGLMRVSDHDSAPRLQRIDSGSVIAWFGSLFGKGENEKAVTAFVQSLEDSSKLHRSGGRAEFRERMYERLGAEKPAFFGAPSLMMPFGPRRPELVAAGVAMFACQALEESYRSMGAQAVLVEHATHRSPNL